MSLRRWSVTLLAALVALVTIAPLLWMVSVSFMARGEAAQFPPPLWPASPTLENYRLLFGSFGVGRFLLNIILVSTPAQLGRASGREGGGRKGENPGGAR